jgi:hypothetical protein
MPRNDGHHYDYQADKCAYPTFAIEYDIMILAALDQHTSNAISDHVDAAKAEH